VHYPIIDYVHKHKIKISEVKKFGLERKRKRWGLGWIVARKRAVQPLTALAETRFVVRQRSMLVAFCPIPSDNDSTGPCCHAVDFISANGSYSALYAYIDQGSRETDARAAGEGLGIAAGRH
jgi:hypothetical protein